MTVGGQCNEDHSIFGSILGSLILGNYRMADSRLIRDYYRHPLPSTESLWPVPVTLKAWGPLKAQTTLTEIISKRPR